jgi:hypothetical protein
MRTARVPVHRRLGRLATSLAVVVAVAACAPGPTAEGPAAVVNEALAKLEAGDIDGMRTLACAGQEDLIRDQLGLPGTVGGELLPGLDVEALLDAVRLDVSGVDTGEPAINGDVAQVPVTGDIRITFDAEAVRPILRDALELQGNPMTDEQLDALLSLLEAQGQDVPIDESVRVIREDGAWKICQESVETAPDGY